MKVLLIDYAVDTHSERLLNLLIEAGHVVGYVASHNRYPYYRENYIYFPYPVFIELNNVRPYYFGKFLRDRFAGVSLRRIWRKFKPDIVHALLINTNAYHCVLGGIRPLILTAFGSDINEYFESKAGDLYSKTKISKTLQFADHITADTREILQRCDLLAGRKLDSSLSYFGIDLDLFQPAHEVTKLKLRRELGISLSLKVIFSPRRIIPKMRHDLVLKAFAKLINRKTIDGVLILRKYGSYSSEYENMLIGLASQLQITDRLIWLEKIDYEKMPILYSLSDLVINVPEQDGLPVTLFEASACMVPIITSNLSAYQEFLSKGSYITVPVGDDKALVETMEFALDRHNGNMIASLYRNRELIENEANQRKCLLATEKLYRQILYRV